jgi:hypothetical protein
MARQRGEHEKQPFGAGDARILVHGKGLKLGQCEEHATIFPVIKKPILNQWE